MNRSSLFTASAAVAATFALGHVNSASAYTLDLDSYQSTPAFPSDTRLNGSATPSAVTVDGTHNLVQLQTTDGVDSQEKAAPFFYTGTLGNSLGTLGDLAQGSLTADWQFGSRGSNTPSFVHNIAAFRILVDGPVIGTTAEIVWENGYQSNPSAFEYAPGAGDSDIDLGSGKFWVRYAGQNYLQGDNGPINPKTLGELANGDNFFAGLSFNASTNIYGLQASIGSAAGDYTGYVGDINASFVPEPTSLGLVALGGVALLGRRGRRQTKVAQA